MNTMKDLASNALAVQNAPNLSGIIHSFSRDISTLRTLLEAEGKGGTEAVNRHPVCILYATQIAFLTGVAMVCDSPEAYHAAYEWAKEQTDPSVRAANQLSSSALVEAANEGKALGTSSED